MNNKPNNIFANKPSKPKGFPSSNTRTGQGILAIRNGGKRKK